MEILEFAVTESGLRLDKFLSENSSLSRSAVASLIEDGKVTVNGKAAAKSIKLKQGDVVSAEIPEPTELDVTAEDIPLEIVYEDDDLLVVNKPKDMVVHPAPGNYTGTLVNALMFHCGDSLSGINGVIRPGIVHRIDKDTSGLLIVAKNDKAHVFLAEQIQADAAKADLVMDILLEVNVAEEESKFGFKVEEVEEAVRTISAFPNVHICGLMTIAPFVDDAEENRPVFKKLYQLAVDIKSKSTGF